jgi:hypothetical protein
MQRLVSRMPLAVAFAVGLVVGPSTPPVEGSVLCRSHRGGLLVRDTCKPREETLDPARLDQLGLRGPAGPVGPVGPPGGGLKVLDAAGAEVGLVTSLQTYYGQYASVVREATLPGGSGPEFIAFSVTAQGLATSEYACTSYYGTYFPNADCTGDPFQTCEYGSCSSVAGAFLYTSLSIRLDGVGCFARGGPEFRRGDFYHQAQVNAPSIDAVTAACVGRGGTLLGPVANCGTPQFPYFCAQCCSLSRDVGVAPVHEFDLSTVGTPPFRLSR